MQFMLEAARKQRAYAEQRAAWRIRNGDHSAEIGRAVLGKVHGA